MAEDHSSKVKLTIPTSLLQQIRRQAAHDETTIGHIILQSFQAAGFVVKSHDIEIARRHGRRSKRLEGINRAMSERLAHLGFDMIESDDGESKAVVQAELGRLGFNMHEDRQTPPERPDSN